MNNKLPIVTRGIFITAFLLMITGLLATAPAQSAFPNAPTAGTLSVVNDLINDNGGSLEFTDFEFSTNDGTDWIQFEGDGQNDLATDNGIYTIIGRPVAGYDTTYANCTDVEILDNTATCTITNNDIAPKLTLIKNPINDDGGTAAPDDFLLTIGGVPATSGVKYELNANTAYAINETLIAGYAFDSITGDAKCPTNIGESITLAAGDDITCTIINDDITPTLTVIKNVINDNGGTLVSGDFTINVTGIDVSQPSFTGEEAPGTTVTLDAGTYNVSEIPVTGYSSTPTGDCSGTIALGETKSCTLTNEDFARLTVIKDPTNNSGGTALPDDFQLTVNGIPVISSIPAEYPIETPLAINETQLFGYTFDEITDDGSGKCPTVLGGTVTLALGDDITCTIVNVQVPAIEVDPLEGLETEENGITDSFSVKLTTIPNDEVTITITSSKPTEGIVDPVIINFNDANWNIPRTVELIGVDDFVTDGDIDYLITLNPKSSVDSDYKGLNNILVTATNLDAPSIEWVQPVGNEGVYFIDKFNHVVLEVINPGDEPIHKVEIARWEPSANDWDTIADFFSPPYRISVPPSEFNIEWNEVRAFAWGPPDIDQRFSGQPFILIYKGYGLFLPYVSR
jgi:hypothetical protein